MQNKRMSQDLVPQSEEAAKYGGSDLTDRSDPRALVNLVPPKLAELIETLPKEYLDMNDRELTAHFKKWKVDITPLENRLRIAFWNEYDNAQKNKKPMVISNVYGGVCSKSYFYDRILRDKHKFAWVLCPPARYTEALEELLHLGIEELRAIMDIPVFNRKTRKVDAKLASVKLEVLKMVDQRLKGSVVQRTQNLHAHISSKDAAAKTQEASESIEDLNKRIAELTHQASLLSSPGGESAPTIKAHDISDAVVIETSHREVTNGGESPQ